MKKKKIALQDIQIDERLTELRPVNLVFVNRYQQAYRAGADMPPIIIDEKTNKIVSGNHQYTALITEFPLEYQITVHAEIYESWLEILKKSAIENATCGNPLDGISTKRISNALIEAGASLEEVAQLFDISVRRLVCRREGDVSLVSVVHGKTVETRVPVKRGLEIEAKKTTGKPIEMNPVQYKVHLKCDHSTDFQQGVLQCNRWLENDWVAYTDKNMSIGLEFEKHFAKYKKEYAKRMKAAA